MGSALWTVKRHRYRGLAVCHRLGDGDAWGQRVGYFSFPPRLDSHLASVVKLGREVSGRAVREACVLLARVGAELEVFRGMADG